MQGMQSHGPAVDGGGAELGKAPVSVDVPNLGCLAENTQDYVLFGSIREKFTDALFGYSAASITLVDSEFLDNNGSRRRDRRVQRRRQCAESPQPGAVLVKPLRQCKADHVPVVARRDKSPARTGKSVAAPFINALKLFRCFVVRRRCEAQDEETRDLSPKLVRGRIFEPGVVNFLANLSHSGSGYLLFPRSVPGGEVRTDLRVGNDVRLPVPTHLVQWISPKCLRRDGKRNPIAQ